MKNNHIKVYLLDKKTEIQYGLNWGLRDGRDPDQAYFQLTPEVYNSDFFPKKGKYFTAITDDNQIIYFNRAQKTEDGTALQTPENNSILGRYLREKFSLPYGKEITKEDILNYGKLDIDFYKVDNHHYVMDFSKNWFTDDITYLFKQYLVVSKICGTIKYAEEIISKCNEALQSNFNESIGSIKVVKDLKVNFATDIPELKVFLGFLNSNYFSAHYSTKKYFLGNGQLAVNDNFQQIFYGAPGTGKSHIINEMTQGESVIRTTFHPDSDYSTFVGAYKPTTKEVKLRDMAGHIIRENGQDVTEDRIVYEFVEQAFLQTYVKAWKQYAQAREGELPKKQFLVIEEINRGNCAQIFGDLFQLLDRNDAGFSDYPIQADNDIRKHLARSFKDLIIGSANSINAFYHGEDVVSKILSGEILLLPNNLYILATMNTSDQSLFPIDSAFKRRWDWQYMPISKGRDKDGNALKWHIKVDNKFYDWWSFLEKVNKCIASTTNSEDKKLGYFFCKAKENSISPETFVGKVIFYLWNDVYKDMYQESGIFQTKNGEDLTFAMFYDIDEQGKTIVCKDKVEAFLNNLEVEVMMGDEKNGEDISEIDESKYSYQLEGYEVKKLKDIVWKVIDNYAQRNPNMSSQDLRDYFIKECSGCGVAHIVETENEYMARKEQASWERSASELTIPNGEKVYISTQWRAKGPDDNFVKFIKVAQEKGWGIIKKLNLNQ